MAISNGSPNPLNVSIVGAGIAGLTAAIALRRQGHLVQVFEASEIKTEIGAGLGVQPNALRVLDHLGVSMDKLGGHPHYGHIPFNPETGEAIGGTTPFLPPGTEKQKPGLMCLRPDLYTELTLRATGDGAGPPVEVHLGSGVVACDPERGTIELSSGETIQADFVLGADGINSVVRTAILGRVETAPASGLSCFRAVFEAPAAGTFPELEWVTAGVSGTRSVRMKGAAFRMIFVYPCRNGSLINFVGFFTDAPGDEADWNPTGSCADIAETFHDLHPRFLRLLDLPVRGPIQKWRLRVLPRLPTWIRGRGALMGDAAHATLPLLGQGAGVAIEEGGLIGCLLPRGTTREDVPARLQAYEDIGKDRGDFLSEESVLQTSRIGDPAWLKRSQEVHATMRNYDAIKVAQDCYQQRFGA
ncbi:hypothetical protein B0H17DRAFT_1092708 [Mycena rosella]|uniref:FAD-binding domain-containing protein n=1 Tax=Mycena rosella TaxID=1033263 RepID=A0AAD7G3V9_MYCRO|nr:hypothetical protein B0H17DRAFT_1092708 [Mycena rosella]